MFKFEPLTQKYVDSQKQLLGEGTFPFVTEKLEEYYPKNGGDLCLKLVTKTRNPLTGNSETLTDFLPLEGKMVFKTRHYLSAIGREDIAESGEIRDFSSFGGTTGLQKVYAGTDQNGAAQTRVRDYLPRDNPDGAISATGFTTPVKTKTTDLSVATPSDKDLEDDDIPF